MSKALVWNDGAPPAVGWWRTTDNVYGDGERWRWWDGDCWSYFATPEHTADQVNLVAAQPLRWTIALMIVVKWCDYWPENARVEGGV